MRRAPQQATGTTKPHIKKVCFLQFMSLFLHCPKGMFVVYFNRKQNRYPF